MAGKIIFNTPYHSRIKRKMNTPDQTVTVTKGMAYNIRDIVNNFVRPAGIMKQVRYQDDELVKNENFMPAQDTDIVDIWLGRQKIEGLKNKLRSEQTLAQKTATDTENPVANTNSGEGA